MKRETTITVESMMTTIVVMLVGTETTEMSLDIENGKMCIGEIIMLIIDIRIGTMKIGGKLGQDERNVTHLIEVDTTLIDDRAPTGGNHAPERGTRLELGDGPPLVTIAIRQSTKNDIGRRSEGATRIRLRRSTLQAIAIARPTVSMIATRRAHTQNHQRSRNKS